MKKDKKAKVNKNNKNKLQLNFRNDRRRSDCTGYPVSVSRIRYNTQHTHIHILPSCTSSRVARKTSGGNRISHWRSGISILSCLKEFMDLGCIDPLLAIKCEGV